MYYLIITLNFTANFSCFPGGDRSRRTKEGAGDHAAGGWTSAGLRRGGASRGAAAFAEI